jgi:hypothetical protein
VLPRCPALQRSRRACRLLMMPSDQTTMPAASPRPPTASRWSDVLPVAFGRPARRVRWSRPRRPAHSTAQGSQTPMRLGRQAAAHGAAASPAGGPCSRPNALCASSRDDTETSAWAIAGEGEGVQGCSCPDADTASPPNAAGWPWGRPEAGPGGPPDPARRHDQQDAEHPVRHRQPRRGSRKPRYNAGLQEPVR